MSFVARLDGTNKPMKHTTIEDYLQMDGWEPPPTSSNGKKRVRTFMFSSILKIIFEFLTLSFLVHIFEGSLGGH